MSRVPSWRSPDPADYLRHIDRSGFAWEFLRRNPAYRKDHDELARRVADGVIDQDAATTILERRWGLSFPVRPAARRGPRRRAVAAEPVARERYSRCCAG